MDSGRFAAIPKAPDFGYGFYLTFTVSSTMSLLHPTGTLVAPWIAGGGLLVAAILAGAGPWMLETWQALSSCLRHWRLLFGLEWIFPGIIDWPFLLFHRI